MTPTTPAEMLKLLGDLLQGGKVWEPLYGHPATIALIDALQPVEKAFVDNYAAIAAACEEVEA